MHHFQHSQGLGVFRPPSQVLVVVRVSQAVYLAREGRGGGGGGEEAGNQGDRVDGGVGREDG